MALYDYTGAALDVSGSPVVNVKDFGAKGNGSSDDAAAIQAAIDSVQTLGGLVYFPSGIYIIKTQIFFYSCQVLFFEKGATLKQGAAINNLLMTYCAADTTEYNGTHDAIIYGATFDGGAFTTNNTLVGTVHAKNIIFENCTIKNAYGIWHNMEINSSYNVKVVNCDFEGSRKTGANGELLQIDALNGESTWPWANRGSIDGTVSQYIEICGCFFHDNPIAPAIGNHSGVGNKFIRIHDCIFDTNTSTRGAINLDNSKDVTIYDNTFTDCTTGVASYESTHWIYNNIFKGVTTATAGSSSVVHDNFINGTYTA